MLVDVGAQENHLERAKADAGGLGLFVRSLVGLDRSAPMEAFAEFLDESKCGLAQVRFVTLLVNELTATGVMDPRRLYESPFTDDMPQGPDVIFSTAQIISIAQRLRDVKAHAMAEEVSA